MSAPIGRLLERDHAGLHCLLGKVLSARGRDAAAGLRRFHQRLTRHIVWEEEVLFPALLKAAPAAGLGPFVAALEGQHARIRVRLARAARLLAGPRPAEARTELRRLAASLSAHHRAESRAIYRAFDETLGAESSVRLLALLRG